MIDIILTLGYFITAFIAGIIGALLGIGGGIILVPALTIGFGMNIKLAIGASLTAVVATSSTAASSYIKKGLSNIRLGLFLEAGTAMGALLGAMIAVSLNKEVLLFFFSIVVLYASYLMYASSKQSEASQLALKNDRIADMFQLQDNYINLDKEDSPVGKYYVDKVPEMFGVSMFAGMASGLLGVGGGFIKVPALSRVSKLPIKAAAATSTFMIGVTAGTSALVYLNAGFIDPILAVPTALGTLFGSLIGARLIHVIHGNKIKVYFAILLVFIAIQLFLKAFGII